MENKLFPNNSLFIIPSWGNLIGYPTLGMYAHHQVSRIVTDAVIFFSSYDYSIDTTKGTLYYLFGFGYHLIEVILHNLRLLNLAHNKIDKISISSIRDLVNLERLSIDKGTIELEDLQKIKNEMNIEIY